MLLSDPAVVQDQGKWRALMREHSQLEPLDQAVRRYAELEDAQKQARALLDEPDMAEMAKEELAELENRLAETRREIQLLLLPKDPNAERNVVMEIRGGAGGEEAALFAGTLYRMYTMYSESRRWHIEVINANETELGGFKEIVFMIEGAGAYSRLKYESGVHRVQRVPDTETQGRIHTSTVTVAVLPEAEDVELEINPADLKIDTFRSSGAGGQHINKTSSAIRVTHIPTGTVVECQDERSQYKNKDKALKILAKSLLWLRQTVRVKKGENMEKSKLEKYREEKDAAYAENRRTQVGTGDRSERIRTYNYPQGRVTDHRIGLTLYKLEQILNGDMDEIIDALTTFYRTEALRAENGE